MKQIFSRILAITLLLITVALVWQIFFGPAWSSMAVEREQRSQYLERTARQHAIQARAADYAQWLKQNPERLVEDRVYAAKTVNSAETQLQRDVNAAAKEAGAVVNSIEGAPAKKATGFVQMTIRLNLSANADQLAAFLERLKDNERIVSVGRGSVRIRRQEDEFGPADLAVSLELIAYAKV